jgi:hypothetical protein
VIPLSFRLPNAPKTLDVTLELETFRAIITELRRSRPALATRIEEAGLGDSVQTVELRDRDLNELSLAARTLREGRHMRDPALALL